MTTTDTTERRSHIAVQEDLDTITAAGRYPSLALLHEAIRTNDDGGPGCIPQNVGMRWIGDNTAAFLAAVDQARMTPLDFFMEHQQGIGRHRIGQALFIGAIYEDYPLEQRAAFARAILLEFGTPNVGWLQVARAAGVNDEELAEMIVEKIRRSDYVSGQPGFICDFVMRGFGRFEQVRTDLLGVFLETNRSYWHLLSATQFRDVVQEISAKWPSWLFEHADFNHHGVTNYHRFVARLHELGLDEGQPEVWARAQLALAAEYMTDLSSVSRAMFALLSFRTKFRLIRKCGFSLFHVIDMAVEFRDTDAAHQLVREFEQPLRDLSAEEYYPLWVEDRERRRRNGTPLDKRVAGFIDEIFRTSLNREGWVVGTLTRSTDGRNNLQVSVGQKTYVKARQQERYGWGSGSYPAAGDLVMFMPKHGRRLTPAVTAVRLKLAYRAPEA